MHDLSLGGPVETDDTSPLHRGHCNDGVYGCTRCWNADNNGKGTESTCDWCKSTALTRIVRSFEEPVLFALCDNCQRRHEKARQEAIDEYDDYIGDDDQ